MPPGASMSPRLPVNWSLDSVGFKDVVAALGGKLKVDAQAIVGVRVGKWEARVRYVGRGVGAGVRL